MFQGMWRTLALLHDPLRILPIALLSGWWQPKVLAQSWSAAVMVLGSALYGLPSIEHLRWTSLMSLTAWMRRLVEQSDETL